MYLGTSIYPPQIVGDGPSFRKMDLVAIAPDAGNEAPATALCIDVSVVDATAPSYGPRRGTLRPGSRGGLSAATTCRNRVLMVVHDSSYPWNNLVPINN